MRRIAGVVLTVVVLLVVVRSVHAGVPGEPCKIYDITWSNSDRTVDVVFFCPWTETQEVVLQEHHVIEAADKWDVRVSVYSCRLACCDQAFVPIVLNGE